MLEKYKQLNERLNSGSFILEIFPNAKKRGRDYVIGNIKGDAGDSLTIFTDTGKWKDFATGEGGDLISAYAHIRGLSQGKAFEELAKRYGVDNDNTPVRTIANEMKEDKTDFFQHIKYEGNLDDEFLLNTIWRTSYHYKNGFPDPEFIYKYLDKEGDVQFLVFRLPPHALNDNRKDFKPYTFGIIGREKAARWHNKLLLNPRPLYNIHNWNDDRNFTIIVEGEKCVDKLEPYLGARANIITWAGGSAQAHLADWEALKGSKKILIVPDNDEAGYKSAKTIYNILIEKKVTNGAVIIGNIPDDKPKGWDIADYIEELEAIEGVDVKAELVKFFGQIGKEKKSFKGNDGWVFENNIKENIRALKKFTCLGYGANGDEYYFYSDLRNEVLVYDAKDLKNTAKLKVLAEERFWYALFGEETKQGIKLNLTAIETALITYCQNMGRFDMDKKRLIGAYNDEDRVVIHLGSKLLSNGFTKSLDFDSEFIYEAELTKIQVNTDAEPLTEKEARDILSSLDTLKFGHELDLRFLIGWYFAAPLSGMWEWRSHLWMIGESGAGKSTVASLMNSLLSNFKKFYNNATEAGIRSDLKSRTLPVIFDEFEQNVVMTDAVLQLMRTGSSDSDADITKGTGGGKGAVKYRIRSMFFALSTMSGLKLMQDNNRFTTITLKKNLNFEEYVKRLMNLEADWRSKNYSDKFLMRCFKLAKLMRTEWSRFKIAITEIVKDSRDGDQLATLTVAAWFFYNDNPPSDEQLKAFLVGYENYAKDKKTGQTDFESCWQIISSKQIRMELTSIEGKQIYITKTIGELILHLLDENKDGRIKNNKDVHDVLNRYGIKMLTHNRIAISNTHPELEKLFLKTNWDNHNWKVGLQRGSGAFYIGDNEGKPVRFNSIVSKVVVLDSAFLLTEKDPF